MGRAKLCKRDRIVLCNTHEGGRSCQRRALTDRICSSVNRLAPALGIDHLRMPVDSYKPGCQADEKCIQSPKIYRVRRLPSRGDKNITSCLGSESPPAAQPSTSISDSTGPASRVCVLLFPGLSNEAINQPNMTTVSPPKPWERAGAGGKIENNPRSWTRLTISL
jgi:hypothetical protein